MRKDFSLSNDKVMVNFSVKYCDTSEKILDSRGFQKLLTVYVERIKKRNTSVYTHLIETLKIKEEKEMVDTLVTMFKLLVALPAAELLRLNEKYKPILSKKEEFIDFIEDLYAFWRRLERYTIIQNNKVGDGLESVSFIDANAEFSKLVRNLYRKIEENAVGVRPSVYRQLPVGGNAGLILQNREWPIPEQYESLKGIPFIDSILLDTPFISYPKKNKRDGMFSEYNKNPLRECTINKDHWFCYPAKVGNLLAYIYFHRDFMAHGVTLCNLFELAKEEECRGVKPDIVYVFGARDNENKERTIFYDDLENNIMLGYVSYSDAIDYFGYMKKMTLTLHNLIEIKKGHLPIHGAMVKIRMNNGKTANIVIMGDSGAGKSESLEAFRALSEGMLSDMTIIFDDMGVMKLNEEDKIIGTGTEIGAFVRLDDLDSGYAFKELDRSIFMNPDKTNARLVMPISSYKDIIKGGEIDLFLYANNYEEQIPGKEIEFFDSVETAMEVFKDGKRMAKGTTTENGLVTSYFANPFGPAQKQEETDILIESYFKQLFEKGVKVGQIRTALGIPNQEKEGPKKAALQLLQIIKKL